VALFFDKAWFDDALRQRSLTRADLANVAGISVENVTLMFKDQMEVPPSCVAAWARLLAIAEPEIAIKCGVSTRTLPTPTDQQRFEALERRVTSLEALVMQLNARSLL
jgi:hypothetical protein